SERTAIVDRFKVVLDELELKGGDAKSYKQYIDAINTVQLDLQDAEGVGVRLISWLQSAEGGLRWAGNLGKFLGIVLASIIVSQALAIFLKHFLVKFDNVSGLMREFTIMLVKRGGVVVGFMLALTALEISLGPIIALLGGASFVLAFALQSNLGNLASGLMMMLYKPFDVGDEVKINGIWGNVDSITLA
ncbi:MAG: mechanosensitive ion channel domain-containing protein, partial [Cyanobacteria bacterium J06632_19]